MDPGIEAATLAISLGEDGTVAASTGWVGQNLELQGAFGSRC